MWIAALQAEGASAASVRRHLAALSELARDPAAAAALLRHGVSAAIGVVLLRHGSPVIRAVTALMNLLDRVAPAGSGDEEEGAARV
jgi:hypothetical protein